MPHWSTSYLITVLTAGKLPCSKSSANDFDDAEWQLFLQKEGRDGTMSGGLDRDSAAVLENGELVVPRAP